MSDTDISVNKLDGHINIDVRKILATLTMYENKQNHYFMKTGESGKYIECINLCRNMLAEKYTFDDILLMYTEYNSQNYNALAFESDIDSRESPIGGYFSK